MISIPAGTEGTKQTLKIMRDLVLLGKKAPRVRQLANDLTKDYPQKDRLEEIKTLHQFVRDNIRYLRDIRGIETLHTAEKILENKQGDCDDKSILLASLLESVGHKTRLIALGFSKPKKSLLGTLTSSGYSHVLPQVFYRGQWISLESTEPVAMGWHPPNSKSALIIYN